jgi:hypothetical protein
VLARPGPRPRAPGPGPGLPDLLNVTFNNT